MSFEARLNESVGRSYLNDGFDECVGYLDARTMVDRVCGGDHSKATNFDTYLNGCFDRTAQVLCEQNVDRYCHANTKARLVECRHESETKTRINIKTGAIVASVAAGIAAGVAATYISTYSLAGLAIWGGITAGVALGAGIALVTAVAAYGAYRLVMAL